MNHLQQWYSFSNLKIPSKQRFKNIYLVTIVFQKYPGQRSRDNGNLDELLFSNVPRKIGKPVDKNEKSTTKIPVRNYLLD